MKEGEEEREDEKTVDTRRCFFGFLSFSFFSFFLLSFFLCGEALERQAMISGINNTIVIRAVI